QSRYKGSRPRFKDCSICPQKSNSRQLPRLLSACHHRPRRRTAEPCDEFPSPHARLPSPEGSIVAAQLGVMEGGLPRSKLAECPSGPCPKWVISRHCRRLTKCPLYHRKQTSQKMLPCSLSAKTGRCKGARARLGPSNVARTGP